MALSPAAFVIGIIVAVTVATAALVIRVLPVAATAAALAVGIPVFHLILVHIALSAGFT